MKIKEIIKIMEDFAPESLAGDFDNVGLLVGDEEREVKRVLTALDVDIHVVREAAQLGAGLIISHHPIMFSPVKGITAKEPEGRVILELIENKIALYSAHTNLDAADGGINDELCARLKIADTKVLERGAEGLGVGRVGIISGGISLLELAKRVKRALNMGAVRYTGDGNDFVSRAAVCSGGGGGLIKDAILSGAEVYITGDIKYNDARDALARGLRLIEIGHYESEILAAGLIARRLEKELSGIEVAESFANVNIYRTL